MPAYHVSQLDSVISSHCQMLTQVFEKRDLTIASRFSKQVCESRNKQRRLRASGADPNGVAGAESQK